MIEAAAPEVTMADSTPSTLAIRSPTAFCKSCKWTNEPMDVAEYAALLCLLHRAVERNAAELTVHSDSELLIKQMLGSYRVRNPRLQAFHAAARRLMARIPKVTFRHVPREENREADLLANRAMDAAASSSPLPEEVARLLDAPVQGLLSLREGV